MSVNSRLKTTKIIGQRKALYKQRIPEPRVQEKQQVKDQQPCIIAFVACLTIPSSN